MNKRPLALILTAIVALMAFSSCGYIFGEVAEQGDVTVVIENTDGTYDVFEAKLDSVENKKEGVKGVVEHLGQRKDRLCVEMTDGGYGAYVSAIGSIREDSSRGKYVMVYTSVVTDSYEGAPTVEYEGVTLYQSGVGISGMSVNEGTVILFRLESY